MPERPGPSSPSPVSLGDVLLKRYRIVELMAEGGHSFVYRAQDERLRRPACVKLLRRSAIDPLFRRTIEQRFVQEAFLLARLAHPSILRVYDFGYLPGAHSQDEGELPFQVCEMISGGPLSRWVKRRIRLDPQEVVALVMPLARALAEVHGAGLVHLDVKPQNILLVKTPSGREPKLADFGIAQAIPSGLPAGTSSVLLYSVNWAAPEQMVGDPVSGACDVHSLALVTAYALTGRLIYQDGDPAQAYRMRKDSDAILAAALASAGLPDPVIELFQRACRFDPSQRIGDVLEFGAALQSCLGALGGAAGAPATEEPSSPIDTAPGERSLPGWVTAANLWPLSVDQPAPVIAGRQLRFVPLAGSHADIEPNEGIRLRVSVLPGPADRLGLHVLGLNCFVSAAGRRPSSAVTLEGSSTLEFYSAGRERMGQAEVAFATAGPQKSVVMLAGHSLVVPAEDCPHLVALDFGSGSSCILMYDRGG